VVVLVAVIVALAFPLVFVASNPARGAQPQLAITGALVPGGRVDVIGTEFPPAAVVAIAWDGAAVDIPWPRTDADGRFVVSFTVPASASPGPYTISAATLPEPAALSGGSAQASAVVTVTTSLAITSSTGPVASPDQGAASPDADAEAVLPVASPSARGGDGEAAAESGAAEGTHDEAASQTPPPSAAHDHATAAAPGTPAPTPEPAAAHPPAHVGVSSPGCEGYPEPRIWLEAQSWWLQTPGMAGTDFGHAHVGTCFPYGVPVSGSIGFDVKVTMFNNPGTLVRLAPHVATAAGDSVNFDQPVLNWTPGGSGVAELWQHVEIDTTRIPLDGLQELRMFAQIREPDGKEMHVSTGWQLHVANGRSSSDYRPQGLAFTEGRGWYTDVDYTVARFASPIPPVVSGTWSFNVDLKPGAGGIPVTSHMVAVNPNHHAGDPGWVVKSGGGEYVGPISIDTGQLPNGVHRLMLRADAAAPTGSTNSGILVLYFNVQN
jgi:hypothetical protein